MSIRQLNQEYTQLTVAYVALLNKSAAGTISTWEQEAMADLKEMLDEKEKSLPEYIPLTEAEVDELARLDAIKRPKGHAHEL